MRRREVRAEDLGVHLSEVGEGCGGCGGGGGGEGCQLCIFAGVVTAGIFLIRRSGKHRGFIFISLGPKKAKIFGLFISLYFGPGPVVSQTISSMLEDYSLLAYDASGR